MAITKPLDQVIAEFRTELAQHLAVVDRRHVHRKGELNAYSKILRLPEDHVFMQVGVEDQSLRVSMHKLELFCRSKGYDYANIYRQARRAGSIVKSRLLAYTRHAGPPEDLWEFDLPLPQDMPVEPEDDE